MPGDKRNLFWKFLNTVFNKFDKCLYNKEISFSNIKEYLSCKKDNSKNHQTIVNNEILFVFKWL